VIVLGIDTATPDTVVALQHPDGRTTVASQGPDDAGRPRHVSCLLPLCAELLERDGLAWGDVERIAVGIGPGTFTGLRIGVSTARGLASARGVPLVGVSTLAAIAAGADGAAPVVAALDARRSEIFAARWDSPQAAARGEAASVGPVAVRPHDLVAALGDTRAEVVGDGGLRYAEVLRAAGFAVSGRPHGVCGPVLCAHARDVAEPGPLAGIVPLYVRAPDAVPTAQRLAQGGQA